MKPLITIGITAYNAADTIEAAIRSALAQTWPNMEIIVVDDFSTDTTPAIIARMVQPNFGISLIRQGENGGVAAARNVIIDAAQGEFIAFFDDDDVSRPDRLERQFKRIADYEAAHPDAPLVICHAARLQNYPGGVQSIERTMGTAFTTAPHGPDVARRILYGLPVADGFGACATCAQMARRSLYHTMGGFDPQFRRGEDTDLNIRIALAGGHFPGISEPLVTQAMTLTDDKHLDRERVLMQALVEKHRYFLEQDGQYGFTKAWFDMKFDLLSGHRAVFAGKLVLLALRYPLKTLRRVLWTLPNIGFNLRQKDFHSRAERVKQ